MVELSLDDFTVTAGGYDGRGDNAHANVRGILFDHAAYVASAKKLDEL